MKLDVEEKKFMAFPDEGIKNFQDLLTWEISNTYEGVNVNFCRELSRRLELKFEEQYGRSSKNNNRLWVSESTVSRWLRSGVLDIKIQLLTYLAQTEMLRDPQTLKPLTVNDLIDILQGRMTISFNSVDADF